MMTHTQYELTPSIEIKKLFVFCVVCEQLSFTKAAKILSLSQSTVSHHIATLEKDLQLPLVRRNNRVVELTIQGEKVYRYARDIFDSFKKFESYLSQKKVMEEGTLRIYGGENSLLDLVLDQVQAFKAQFPQFRFDIMGRQKFPTFTPYQLTVGLFEKAKDQLDVFQTYLMTFHLGLYASASYIKRFGQPKSIEDLENHRLVFFENAGFPFSSFQDWLLEEGMPKGRRRDPYLIINTLPLIYEAAKKGLGVVALARESDVIEKNGLEELLPTVLKPDLKVYFMCHAEHKEVPPIIAFYDHLSRIIKERGWT